MKKLAHIYLITLGAFSLVSFFGLSAFAGVETEENGKIANANRISVNETIYGMHDSCYDVDYYSFSLSEDGYIYINLSNERYDGTVYLDILDSTGKGVDRIGFNYVKETHTSLKIGLASGEYYLVYNSGDIHNIEAGQKYSICINYVRSNSWEKELNDSLAKATDIAVDKTTNASFQTCYDADFFRVNIADSGYYQVSINNTIADDYIKVTVFDDNGQQTDYFNHQCLKPSYDSKRLYLKSGENYIKFNITNSDDLEGEDYSFCVAKVASEEKNTTINQTTSSVVYYERTTSKQTTTNAIPVVGTTAQPDAALTVYVVNNYFQYIVIDGEINIYRYIGGDRDVTVPQTIQGMTVTGISGGAFENTQAKVVRVPDTVVDLGKNAFGEDTGSSIRIVCSPNSAAERYAADNGIRYVYIDETLNAGETTESAIEEATERSPIVVAILIAIGIIIFAAAGYFLYRRKTQ